MSSPPHAYSLAREAALQPTRPRSSGTTAPRTAGHCAAAAARAAGDPGFRADGSGCGGEVGEEVEVVVAGPREGGVGEARAAAAAAQPWAAKAHRCGTMPAAAAVSRCTCRAGRGTKY